MIFLSIGIIIGLSFNASAQTTTIPSWVKNTAKWWGEGQISDSDYIQSLQWLIDNGILNIPKSNSLPSTSSQGQQNIPPPQQNTPQGQPTAQEGFSGTQCARDQTITSIVHMTGKYTNGPTSYSSILLTLGLSDASGNVVATGTGFVSDLGPYQTKIFDAEAVYSGDFVKCDIQVGAKIP